MNCEHSEFNICSADMDPNGDCGNPRKLMKFVSDPIHELIPLHPVCIKLIDTIEFQRLRNIMQCGFCKFVYPSAVHSRFEHCLGVYYLTGEMIEALEKNTGKKLFQPHEKLCIQIAGLIHDLGHGPFSHTWEKFLIESNVEFKHEKMSEKMFDHLIEKNNLCPFLNEYGIGLEQIQLIKDMIKGELSSEIASAKPYMFEIVANKNNHIDVDKWDYMMRDGKMFGVPFDVSYKRLLSGVKLDDKNHIIYKRKIKEDKKELFDYRAKMHKKCYQHRVAISIETMFIDAMKEASSYTISLGDKRYKLTECHQNCDAYTKLSDYIFYNILYSEEKELTEARKLLERIEKRNLYTFLGNFPLEKGTNNSNPFIHSPEMLNKFRETMEQEFPGNYFRVTKQVYSAKHAPDQFDPSHRYGATMNCFCTNVNNTDMETINKMQKKCEELYETFCKGNIF